MSEHGDVLPTGETRARLSYPVGHRCMKMEVPVVLLDRSLSPAPFFLPSVFSIFLPFLRLFETAMQLFCCHNLERRLSVLFLTMRGLYCFYKMRNNAIAMVSPLR